MQGLSGTALCRLGGSDEPSLHRECRGGRGWRGRVTFYTEADRLGADCLITGEITSKIDSELGRERQTEIEAYLPLTKVAAVGLSHAGSEFLVMRDVASLVERKFGIPAEAVPESRWWR